MHNYRDHVAEDICPSVFVCKLKSQERKTTIWFNSFGHRFYQSNLIMCIVNLVILDKGWNDALIYE